MLGYYSGRGIFPGRFTLKESSLNFFVFLLPAYQKAFFCVMGPHLPMVTRHGVFLKPSEHILEELANVREPIVLCAHSHMPRSVYPSNGQLIWAP